MKSSVDEQDTFEVVELQDTSEVCDAIAVYLRFNLSMVIGRTPPETLTGIAAASRPAERSTSMREPSSGNWMCSACSLPVRTSSPSGRNRRNGLTQIQSAAEIETREIEGRDLRT